MTGTRARFAPSPTGSLHVGNALSACVNRRIAGVLVLRIDDTDPERNVPGGEEAILRDLEWLGLGWDEGPVRQSERAELHRAAAERIGERDPDGALRWRGTTLLRADGSPTYQLASVVDDADLRIDVVARGNDHRPNEALHRDLAAALGLPFPEIRHHGLLLGEDGRKLSKRERGTTVAELRESGIPAAALRAYLEELGEPRHDVRYDAARIRSLAVDAIAAMPDEALAAELGIPAGAVPAVRGAHTLAEARAWAAEILERGDEPVPAAAGPTLERFRELRSPLGDDIGVDAAKAVLRELKAVGGDLKALRLALTGRGRGPALAAVLAALPRDESLRRVDAAR